MNTTGSRSLKPRTINFFNSGTKGIVTLRPRTAYTVTRDSYSYQPNFKRSGSPNTTNHHSKDMPGQKKFLNVFAETSISLT
jgi:hypothetical protein